MLHNDNGNQISNWNATYAPPLVLVLWWIPFHTTQLERPVVIEVPTVKEILRLKAVINSRATSRPSSVLGTYAVREVPEYLCPGCGCSGRCVPLGKE